MTPNESQQRAIDKWEAANNSNGEYECSDTYRYATKGNADQEREYEMIAEGGCCGSCDVELECDDGTTLLYGFNYGH